MKPRSLIIFAVAFVFATAGPLARVGLASFSATVRPGAADATARPAPAGPVQAFAAVHRTLPDRTPAPAAGSGGGLILAADEKKRSTKKSSRRSTKKASRSGSRSSSGKTSAKTTAGAASGAWKAERKGKGKSKICYIVSFPRKKEGKYTRRDPTYLVVAHRPGERVFNEVSVEAGYDYKPDSIVTAQIDRNQTYKLFTRDGNAWPTNPAADKVMVTAMKRGRTLVLKGTSSRGTPTTDTYSLSGFTRALAKVDKDCPG
jgi:hypothetical protein